MLTKLLKNCSLFHPYFGFISQHVTWEDGWWIMFFFVPSTIYIILIYTQHTKYDVSCYYIVTYTVNSMNINIFCSSLFFHFPVTVSYLYYCAIKRYNFWLMKKNFLENIFLMCDTFYYLRLFYLIAKYLD